MQEPTDDQLDGLFRKSAEEYDAPFDPAAWQAMKNRLDTHDRLTIWEHLLRWGLPALLLLVLTGGSWNAHRQRSRVGQVAGASIAVRQSAPTNEAPLPDRPVLQEKRDTDGSQRLLNRTTTVLTESTDSAKATVNQLDDGKRTVSGSISVRKAQSTHQENSPLITDRDRQSVTRSTNSRIAHPDVPTALAGSTHTPEFVRPSLSIVSASVVKRSGQDWFVRAGRERLRQPGSKQTANRINAIVPAADHATETARAFTEQRATPDETTGTSTDKLQSGIGPLPADVISAHHLSVGTPDNDAPTLKRWADMTLFTELTNQPGQWPKPLSFARREVAMPDVPTQTQRPASALPVPSQKGLSVRFVVSPDLSAIGLRNFRRPGTNVGLLLEYRLASRWSVQAGVLRSAKVYKAATTDYELPAYVAKWYVKPESVNGRCTVLDIPINLRYDVLLRPRPNGLMPSRWFVSAGVTTYIMQQEEYVYDYAEQDKPYVKPNMGGWSGKTGRYNFSQLNLSAGYERVLSQRLSWQVEPFVKAPLKGVGHYRINLLSTGAFFSLRYKL